MVPHQFTNPVLYRSSVRKFRFHEFMLPVALSCSKGCICSPPPCLSFLILISILFLHCSQSLRGVVKTPCLGICIHLSHSEILVQLGLISSLFSRKEILMVMDERTICLSYNYKFLEGSLLHISLSKQEQRILR